MTVRRLAETQPESFDFTPENRAWVDRQIRKYPEGRQASAVMALLRRAQQQHHGWVPKPAIERIADILGMPYIRVLEVATFYTMYNLKPVGEHFIQFCGTTPCVLRGANDIKAVLERRVGPMETVSADGKFSWLEVECLGACCNAPMVQINDDYYEDLTPENFDRLLDDLAAGRPVKRGSQTGRLTSEPANGLTSLTTWYGVNGDEDRFATLHEQDNEAELTAADRDPALDDALQARDTQSAPDHERAAAEKARQDGAEAQAKQGGETNKLGHGGLDGQHAPLGGNARPEGSVAGTGTRTDDPVGTGQIESSAVHKPHPEADADRQEQPPKADPAADRGTTGPGSPAAGPAASDKPA
ncbi:NADH-quinone oxidoreductase subunit NuoE [Lichenibacterium dinghuense]|uniref:NADH-quinone oxidoreductase subunit NuoE n=1 Tax=Lichenibacterium dinghuense TaxID=2895977 RepID=UPI001F3195C2|nr:NADH-quinone oxidoreductase subunit NuoE [Lichenibacterium sp. 6Y81]